MYSVHINYLLFIIYAHISQTFITLTQNLYPFWVFYEKTAAIVGSWCSTICYTLVALSTSGRKGETTAHSRSFHCHSQPFLHHDPVYSSSKHIPHQVVRLKLWQFVLPLPASLSTTWLIALTEYTV